MSLYYEAANILDSRDKQQIPLKQRVYNDKKLKAPPGAIFALVSEATKWSSVLSEVIEKSGILSLERKLTPTLALLLVHDLLLAKKGIAAPKQHALTLAVSKHKARLSAELTKIRIRRGVPSLEAFRQSLQPVPGVIGAADEAPNGSADSKHPRWVRVNGLKTTLKQALATTFADFAGVGSLSVLMRDKECKTIYIDPHIPNLVGMPPSIDLTKWPAYSRGEIILQDKASCFPAYLLNPSHLTDSHVMDCCAAPGNKTTHLAAILHEHSLQKGTAKSSADQSKCKITACERSTDRAKTLQKMLDVAGAHKDLVTVRAGQDSLALKPNDPAFKDVTALLLDPSCSGSGIVGRDDENPVVMPVLELPSRDAGDRTGTNGDGGRGKKGRKRKKIAQEAAVDPDAASETVAENEVEPVMDVESATSKAEAKEKYQARLRSLAAFQLKLVMHAMRFPNAKRIAYSTCSIHATENEHVVVKALASNVARERGWRILKRSEQVDGMRRWERRGDGDAVSEIVKEVAFDGDAEDVTEGCIRCVKGSDEGTMGFFVCGFVRDFVESDPMLQSVNDVEEESEWEGFD